MWLSNKQRKEEVSVILWTRVVAEPKVVVDNGEQFHCSALWPFILQQQTEVLGRNGWTQEKGKDSSVRRRSFFLFLSTEDQISGRHIFQFLAQNLEFWGKCCNCVKKKKFCKFNLIQNIWKINLRKKSECEPVWVLHMMHCGSTSPSSFRSILVLWTMKTVRCFS